MRPVAPRFAPAVGISKSAENPLRIIPNTSRTLQRLLCVSAPLPRAEGETSAATMCTERTRSGSRPSVAPIGVEHLLTGLSDNRNWPKSCRLVVDADLVDARGLGAVG